MVSRKTAMAFVLVSMLLLGTECKAQTETQSTTTTTTTVSPGTVTTETTTVTKTQPPPGTKVFSKSSEDYYRRGYGGTQGNVTNFHYKKRLQNWSEQLDMAGAKGWLPASDIEKFRADLSRLSTLEVGVSGRGYQKAELDDMEKQFNTFNVALDAAMNKSRMPDPSADSEMPAPAPDVAPSQADSSQVAPAKPAEPVSSQPTHAKTKPVQAAVSTPKKTAAKKVSKPAPKKKR